MPQPSGSNLESRPLRLFLFDDRPDFLLVYAPEGAKVDLPSLRSPFVKTDVSAACCDANVDYRITDAVRAGRWTQTMLAAKSAEKGERTQRLLAAERTEAVIMQGAASMTVRSRSEAILRKQEVDEEIRTLKAWIGDAKTKLITRGIYADRDKYVRKEQKLEALKIESQAIQTRIGELTRAERKANAAEAERRFSTVARRLLPPELFKQITAACEEEEMGSDDDSQ